MCGVKCVLSGVEGSVECRVCECGANSGLDCKCKCELEVECGAEFKW